MTFCTEKGKGSKVQKLPIPSHSKKFWWVIEAQQHIAYDPTSLFEVFYFKHKRVQNRILNV